MKITININPQLEDTEIAVSCPKLTPETEKIIAALRLIDSQLSVRDVDTYHLIDPYDAIYVEAIERKTFVYTSDKVYESDLKLYELESKLCDIGFCKISKSCIVNLRRIKSLRADVEHRIRIMLDNGEQIVDSRMYSDELREKLGVK